MGDAGTFIAEGSGLEAQHVRADLMTGLNSDADNVIAALIGPNFTATGIKPDSDHADLTVKRILIGDPKMNPLGAMGTLAKPIVTEFDQHGAPTPASEKALLDVAQNGIRDGRVGLEIQTFMGNTHAYLMNKRDDGGNPAAPRVDTALKDEVGNSIQQNLDATSAYFAVPVSADPDFARANCGGLAGWAGMKKDLDLLVVADATGTPATVFSYIDNGNGSITLYKQLDFDKMGSVIKPTPLREDTIGDKAPDITLHLKNGTLDASELERSLTPALDTVRLQDSKKFATASNPGLLDLAQEASVSASVLTTGGYHVGHAAALNNNAHKARPVSSVKNER